MTSSVRIQRDGSLPEGLPSQLDFERLPDGSLRMSGFFTDEDWARISAAIAGEIVRHGDPLPDDLGTPIGLGEERAWTKLEIDAFIRLIARSTI